MNKFERTITLLKKLKSAGYQEVVIGFDPNSPACMWWSSGNTSSLWGWHYSWKVGTRGDDSQKCCRNGSSFPAIWDIGEEMSINGGCGNSHQYQLMYKAEEKVIFGTYILKGKNAIDMIIKRWVLEKL